MSDTIFEKIIAGTVPCYKVYEDDKTLAFLDINPVQPGHTLIIPKTGGSQFVWDMELADYLALMTTVKKVAKQLKQVLNVPFVGEKIVGVDVPYAHVHLIPFSALSEYEKQPIEGQLDHQALNAMAKKVAF